MNSTKNPLTRRGALTFCLGGLVAAPLTSLLAAEQLQVSVYKDPSCGCCEGWVVHMRKAGFTVSVNQTRTAELAEMKRELGVPNELVSCHTAKIGPYVVEGHVPADAIRRLLSERPAGVGLAVPGMPIGSPGMEMGEPEAYEVHLFGSGQSKTFMRFRGSEAI